MGRPRLVKNTELLRANRVIPNCHHLTCNGQYKVKRTGNDQDEPVVELNKTGKLSAVFEIDDKLIVKMYVNKDPSSTRHIRNYESRLEFTHKGKGDEAPFMFDKIHTVGDIWDAVNLAFETLIGEDPVSDSQAIPMPAIPLPAIPVPETPLGEFIARNLMLHGGMEDDGEDQQ